MEEAGDLLEDSWFFGNLLHSKPRTISRSYSDLASNYSHLHPCPALCSTQEHVVMNERKNRSFSSSPGPNMMNFQVGSDKKDVIIKKEPKSSSLSSRKQPPLAPSSLTQIPSLSKSKETQSFQMKKSGPSLTQTSSMSSFTLGSDQDDEDQESEFTLGRLIRQASMNSSNTSNPPRQTSKAMIEKIRKKPEMDQQRINIDARKMERNRSQCRKNNGKSKNDGGAPAIHGGWVDKSSSEDMKAHIKFWARAVASNVR